MAVLESDIPELIRKGRDKEAIENLYDTLLPNVTKYIKNNNGSTDEALDIFQDVILSFYEKVMNQNWDPTYTVYGYLYKMCIWRWINKVNRDKPILKKDISELELHLEAPDYWFSETSSNDDEAILHTMFSSIGEKCLELLTYTIYKDMQMEDIQVRMNFPSNESARMQHQRCKQKLMNEISKNPNLLAKLKGV